MKPKFDLHVRSRVIMAEKANKPLIAIPAPNQHQMNRIQGFLSSGEAVVVAKRDSKGGMDFNKLMSGKVFAVAADGFSPVMVKGPDKKPTKEQEKEGEALLYSSSGFYMLSSDEYPALEILECFTRLHDQGDTALLLKMPQLKARLKHTATTQDELDAALETALKVQLSDELNMVRAFDPKINKKRKLKIDQAKLAASAGDDEDDDAPGAYTGVEYQELTVSPKDGNPFSYLVWAAEGGVGPQEVFILRERMMEGDKQTFMAPCTTEEAIDAFRVTDAYRAMYDALAQGQKLTLAFAQGFAMRTSPMFRGKVTATVTAPAEKTKYGDAVYITGALQGWTPGLVSVLHSKHPGFPNSEYDHLYYTVACRQAEVGMNKNSSGQGYQPPQAVIYDFANAMLM